jgi:DNA-binding NtrC family response regulator
MIAAGVDNVDLLITDVVMPQGSGLDIARLLRDHRPGLKVLYISGYSDDSLLDSELKRPGVAFLQKPFTPPALLQSVTRLLSN